MSASLACLLPGVAGAGDVADLVTTVELTKGYDREDGEVLPDFEEPYFAEICVTGPIAEAPVGTATVKRTFLPFPFDEVIPLPECLEFGFESQQDLDAAFPSNGEVYEFNFSKTGFPADSMNVAYAAPGPQGFADVQSPAHEAADVDPESDLDILWSIDPSSCFPSATVGDCADAMLLFLIDPVQDVEVFANTALPIDATQQTVPADALEPNTLYDLELETYTGELSLPTATNGGDAVTLVAIYRDINNTSFTTVPEPGGTFLGFAAVGAAGLLSRRRGVTTRRS
jgi:hypothetical protein